MSDPAETRVVIVTGGATGLGAAVARGFAAQGSKVVVNYSRSRPEAEETVAQCIAQGGEAVALQGDVGQDPDCLAVVAGAIARWGRVDVLVNNAGQTRKVAHADLAGLSAEDFLDVYRTNVVGTYQMIRACAPHMQAAGGGAVINISSGGADLGVGSSTAYAASKAALNTLTKSLARALAPAIRVNAVAPGFLATSWFSADRSDAEMSALVAEQTAASPLGRVVTPEEVADAVLFLAGPGARSITGTLLPVEGGTLLGLAPKSLR